MMFGFNEAEARTPRMLRNVLVFIHDKPSGSMRPRRARLGCHLVRAEIIIVGRCFNEAEARAPRMLVPVNEALQSHLTLQ